jgi:hypothetical protein
MEGEMLRCNAIVNRFCPTTTKKIPVVLVLGGGGKARFAIHCTDNRLRSFVGPLAKGFAHVNNGFTAKREEPLSGVKLVKYDGAWVWNKIVVFRGWREDRK